MVRNQSSLCFRGDYDDRKILGEKINIKPAPEPANILWENKHISGYNYTFRQYTALTSIAILLVTYFLWIISAQHDVLKIAKTYPQVDCKLLYNDLTGYSEDLIKNQAVSEYIAESTNEPATNIGALPCFCQKSIDGNLYQQYNEKATKFEYTINGVTKEEPICEKYITQVQTVFGMNQFYNKVIVIMNTVIYYAVIIILRKVGYSTESSQEANFTFWVFVCQFFNTGLQQLLITANFKGQSVLLE